LSVRTSLVWLIASPLVFGRAALSHMPSKMETSLSLT
jgi:hypothetical protein